MSQVRIPPFPDAKYSIIYADPPWEEKGRFFHNQRKNPHKKNIAQHYNTLSMKELCDLPVMELAEPDCLMFMWATGINLTDAIELGRAWGFEYKTIAFVWYKDRPVVATYVMSDCEICLLFKRGKIPQPRGKRNIRQFLTCKPGEHSQKPDEVRNRITDMFPSQTKIELFARTKYLLFPPSGWDFWGDEA